VELVTERAKRNKEEVAARWEPLFNNLGHCCRKNKKYEEALEFHNKVNLFVFIINYSEIKLILLRLCF